MLTTDDMRAIPLLSDLGDDELARLAQHAADLQLGTGEYAVHEGGERALYAVLSGRIDAVKLVDGVERVLGQRQPGEIFGEVPLIFGTPFQGAYRAAEPSRVARIEARDYHVLAAHAPQVAQQVGTLASQRIGWLQALAAEPPQSRVTMIGHRWDAACGDLRRFLARNQINFQWLTPDSPDIARQWSGPCPAGENCLAVQLTDGTVLDHPKPRELADRLGLAIHPRLPEYDTVVIGGGPAGLAAAVYGASEGLRTLVLEQEAPGGQAGTSSRIENYLGFPSGVSGDELASRALQQARRLGAEILVTRAAVRIDPVSRQVFLDGEDEAIRTRTIILATGVSWRRLQIPDFDRFIGKGIYYGAARSEAGGTHGLDLYLIGAGNSAGQAAMHFAGHARTVTLVVRGDALEKSMSHYLIEQIRGKSNIAVMLQSEVAAVHGDTHLTAIDIRHGGRNATRRYECGGLFVFIGADAQTDWLPAEIARDARGYVLTGNDVLKAGGWSHKRDPYLLETSMPGVFACGDVRLSPVKRVAAAVGEGSMAIAFVHQYLLHAA